VHFSQWPTALFYKTTDCNGVAYVICACFTVEATANRGEMVGA